MPSPSPPEPAPRSPILDTPDTLLQHYKSYLHMLNVRTFDPPTFGTYVSPDVVHNDRSLGHEGYQGLISPGAHFVIKSAEADVGPTKPNVYANLHITVPEPHGSENIVYDEWVRYYFDNAARIERVESEVVRVGP